MAMKTFGVLAVISLLVLQQSPVVPAAVIPAEPEILRPGELFEGDIITSESEIFNVYDHADIEEARKKDFGFSSAPSLQKRAAISDESKLWSFGQIPYTFDSSFSSEKQESIRKAMDIWEDKTCIRFIPRTSHPDYLHFTGERNECSSSVGRVGGKQDLYLGTDCESNLVGVALHEIGHAIGFWHEQSRPDRDEYVRIITTNIKDGESRNFMKRSHQDIDYQGSGYDYASIMHSPSTVYSRCEGNASNASNATACPTIEVNNADEYLQQGSPILGLYKETSYKDSQQANRLYQCPDPGIGGILKVYIRFARRLPDTDPPLNDPDPYVAVTAVDSDGNRHIKSTNHIGGTENPNWYTWLDFGGDHWQFFRVRIWDEDSFLTGADDSMSMSQTIPIEKGLHTYIKHCVDATCNGYLYFDYNLIADGVECSPNQCQNGGRCIEGISSFTCSCPDNYVGDLCQWRHGNLRVYARYGRRLPDEDPWPAGDSDPYMEVIAYSRYGHSLRKTTSHKGNEDPNWYEWLEFGSDAWWRIKVKVWDSDWNADDALSNDQYFTLQPGSRTYIRHCARNGCRGYVYFDYYFS